MAAAGEWRKGAVMVIFIGTALRALMLWMAVSLNIRTQGHMERISVDAKGAGMGSGCGGALMCVAGGGGGF